MRFPSEPKLDRYYPPRKRSHWHVGTNRGWLRLKQAAAYMWKTQTPNFNTRTARLYFERLGYRCKRFRFAR
jgi:hypothetical protein